MNTAVVKNTFLVLLLTITIFSVFKYGSAVKEKYDLLHTLSQIKEQLSTLEKEKQGLLGTLEKEKELQQQLSQKNTELKDNLEASKNRLAKLFKQANETQKVIEQLDSQLSLLKAENKALIEKEDEWKLRFSQVSGENETLKAKLNSIVELKKAIRELKRQARRVSIEIKQKEMSSSEKIIQGNRGYLIKDGQYTYPAKVKIEVIPAPTKE